MRLLGENPFRGESAGRMKISTHFSGQHGTGRRQCRRLRGADEMLLFYEPLTRAEETLTLSY